MKLPLNETFGYKTSAFIGKFILVSYYLLKRKQLKQTDSAVIVNAEDASEWIKNLKVIVIALKGEEEYVPAPSMLETIKSKEGDNIIKHTISKIVHPSALQQAIDISWVGE
jgi:hypothetical protein